MAKKMLYTIPKEKHGEVEICQCLLEHPEIQFVSLVGIDIYGHDTDEKIPVELIISDIHSFLTDGIQTDGSSVLLPGIADISNGKLDMKPDTSVNWYVDYNYYNIDPASGLPVGTLRIPAFLVHSDKHEVGSRVILRNAVKVFSDGVMEALRDNPYIFSYLPIASADEIDHLELTSATELEFYVKTPHEVADREKLHTSQEMKEQYWKRTVGPVRTALENTINILNAYGLKVEMGHKEVGGVKPMLENGGDFGHIMEQLEIDWKYASPMQAADNDNHVRYVVKDIFRKNGLDVSFMAKPVEGVAGSGKHTHLGLCAVLKDGRRVNLFTAADINKDYLSPVGYGALMGLLKNYEIVAPIVSAGNDAFNRLKPGYEAPVCAVTSLGRSVDVPSRNRTVLVGLIRDMKNPMATRFEMRSPNPKSNTHLVLAAGFLTMLDGIRAALYCHKTPEDLYLSVSKGYGQSDFYLEKNRIYRVEDNVFENHSEEERLKLFGESPATVWQALEAFDLYPDKTRLLFEGDAMDKQDLLSYREAAAGIWATELKDRIIPKLRQDVHSCIKLHGDAASKDAFGMEDADLDEKRWEAIQALRLEIAKDTSSGLSLLSTVTKAINDKNYDMASDLSLVAHKKVMELKELYSEYKKNI